MKHKYRIEPGENKKEFMVYEIASEQCIRKFDHWEGARNYIRKLKRGLGFDGWTPAFFLIDFKTVKE